MPSARTLRVALAALLSFFCTAFTTSAAELRVLHSDASRLELQWTMEEPRLETVVTVDGVARRPSIEGGLHLAEGGRPDVPSLLQMIALPSRRPARVEVVSVSTQRLPLPDAAAAPHQVVGEAEDGGEGAREIRPARIADAPGPQPGAWAEFQGISMLRGQWVDRLALHPVRWDPSEQAMVWARTLRVRIHFDDAGDAAAGRGLARREHASWERMMDVTVLNAETARAWRVADEPVLGRGVADSFESSPNWVRFPITTTGVYRLDYFTFANHGVDPAAVDPRTIRVFAGANRPLNADLRVGNPDFMTECALKDLGDGDDIFDLDDRFLFWAHGPSGWASEFDSDRSRFEYVENAHDDRTYYWVTWDGSFAAPPRRMTTRDVADSTADVWYSSTPHRVHYEQNNTEGFAYRDEDGWMWEDLRGRGDDREYRVPVDEPATGDGVLTARLCSHDAAGRFLRRVELKMEDEVTTYWEWTHGPQSAVYDVTGCFEGLLSDGTNGVKVNADFDDDESIDHIYTAWFDLEYDRALTASGGRYLHFFTDANPLTLPAAPAGSDPCTALPAGLEYGRTAFRLLDFDAAPTDIHLFDVTDQHGVVDLTGYTVQNASAPHHLRFSDPGNTGVRWYVAVTMEGVRSLPAGEFVTPRGLRSLSNGATYLIVHAPEFEAAAQRLADLRATLTDETPMTVDLDDVYQEFSWGMRDPVAVRDFLTATRSWGGGAPIFVVFVGDAAYDTKPYLSGSPPNFFPTFTERFKENTVEYRGTENVDFYSTDDFFAYLEPEDYEPGLQPGLDVAIGRMPVATAAEADVLLDKLESYYAGAQPGQWQNRVILVADDERTLSEVIREPFHTEQVEALARDWLPPALDRVKVYLTEYPRNEFGRKPEAQDAFIDEFTRGALMTTYTGHGDQNTMAQEEVFVSQKVTDLLNEQRYTVFSTFSCTVSKFDLLSGQSMTERLIFHEDGGSVSTFSSGGLVFPQQSARLNREWLGVMYGTPYLIHTFARSSREIGLSALAAKNVVSASGIGLRKNNEKYVLLGDPALAVRFGNHLVEFESATVDVQATDGLLRVIRGTVVDDDGNVLDGTAGTTPFSGTAYVHVTEEADDSGYTYTFSNGSTGQIDYVLDGSTAFRGEVPVTNGRFESKFYLNEGVQTGNNGRVSVFALEEGSELRDASGAHETLVLAPTISPSQVDDSEGPRIVIRFEGYPNFVDGDLIFTDRPILNIELEDANGINLRPFPQFARLEVDVDDRERIDLTGDFSYQEGSFTQGKVRRILPLAPGDYTVRVKAYDNVGNRGEAEVRFSVVLPTDDFDLVDNYVAAYPNPFQGRVDLLYRLTHDAEVELKVFTITGRKVWEKTVSGVMGDNSIAWDGRDENGTPLANGTYLYKLEAKSVGDGEDVSAGNDEFVGKVVRMR